MRTPPLASVLIALALLLTGCTRDAGDDADDADDTEGGLATSHDTTEIPISVQLGGVPAPEPVGSANGAAGTVDVAPNASAILVEARWTCGGPSCPFELVLVDPDGGEVASAPGDAEASVETANATAGSWSVALRYVGQPVVDANGEIRATVFYGGLIPSNFTAFDDGP